MPEVAADDENTSEDTFLAQILVAINPPQRKPHNAKQQIPHICQTMVGEPMEELKQDEALLEKYEPT